MVFSSKGKLDLSQFLRSANQIKFVQSTTSKHLLATAVLCAGMLFYVETLISWGHPPTAVAAQLGLACTVGSICIFASPLGQLVRFLRILFLHSRFLLRQKQVIATKSSSSLPLPLCVANFVVSSTWVVYGLLVHDYFVQVLLLLCFSR